MPILTEITFEDGSKENIIFPAQIWKMNDQEVSRTFATQKIIKKIEIDPKQLTPTLILQIILGQKKNSSQNLIKNTSKT